MLFVSVLKATKASSSLERIARRVEWQFPEGVDVVGEYWLQAADPTVILVFRADGIAPIMASTTAWDDVFEISVYPAVTAEEGAALFREMTE